MNCQFSNSTIKLFHSMMQRKYGEYITVRNPSKNLSSNISYTKRNFLGGGGYIVMFKDEDNIKVDESDLEKVESVGLKWINLCKTQDLTFLEIHKLVDGMYDDEGCDSNKCFL